MYQVALSFWKVTAIKLSNTVANEECTVGGNCQCNIHINARTQGFLEEHRPGQGVTLPACLLPTVHPGIFSSRGKRYTHLAVHMTEKYTQLLKIGHLLPLHHGPALMLTCLLYLLSSFDRGQQRHSDMEPCMYICQKVLYSFTEMLYCLQRCSCQPLC